MASGPTFGLPKFRELRPAPPQLGESRCWMFEVGGASTIVLPKEGRRSSSCIASGIKMVHELEGHRFGNKNDSVLEDRLGAENRLPCS
jgi:hypothetical protein